MRRGQAQDMDAPKPWLCGATAAPSLQESGIVKDGFVGIGVSCCYSLLEDVPGFLPSPVDFSRCFQELKTLGLHRPDCLLGFHTAEGLAKSRWPESKSLLSLGYRLKKGYFHPH